MTPSTAAVTTCPSCRAPNRVPAVATGTPRCGKCQATLAWIADADDRTFTDVVERSPLPVVVDLWAPWCGPCRVVSPILEQLAGEFAGRCKLVKVNVDESPAVARRFAVQGIPTLVAMRAGTELGRQVGAAPAHVLREWISSTLLAPAA